jgi:hypothetical protein
MDDSAKNEFFTIMAQYPEVVAEMFHNGFHAFRNFILENYSFPQFENECKTRNLIFNQENILESDKNKRGNNEYSSVSRGLSGSISRSMLTQRVMVNHVISV